MVVNIYEAKTNLSQFIQLLLSGQEKEIIICNRGKPVVRCSALSSPTQEARPFGVYKDRYPKVEEDDFFALDEEIAKEIEGE